jgi:cytochrome c
MNKTALAPAVAAAILLSSGAVFGADQFAGPPDGRALLERAVVAMKDNPTAAIKAFNDDKSKQFRDRDLYVYCFNLGDGKFTAYESNMLLGVNIRELKLPPDDPVGQRAYDVVHDSPEGSYVTAQYKLNKPGTKVPADKEFLETRIGTQACGVTYFK